MIKPTIKRLVIYSFLGFTIFSLMACGNEEILPLTVKVKDQKGEIIKGASVRISKNPRKLSDANGIVEGTFKKQVSVTTEATKKGYYNSYTVSIFPYDKEYDTKKPIVLVLKEKKNPIPMLVKSWNHGISSGLKIPDARGAKIGYDFFIGDWVKPFGNGIRADIFFKKEGDWGGNLGDEFRLDLRISFPNDKDGLIPFDVPLPVFEQGELRSNYETPKDGYLNQWVQTISKVQGRRYETTKKRERNYYFRIRTVVDSNGKIVSAHYGKIYGDFMSLIYYVNPTPNDRNVEFDVEQNLFKSTVTESTVTERTALERIRKIDRP